MCPNDDGPMQTMQRGGVEFDMCPICRGVWLDRGELEKLISSGKREAPPPPQPGATPWGETPRLEPRYEEPRRYEDDRRYDKHGKPYRKKREGFDLSDIFG
jgi:Zn-finger nucleic acid-binding protein